MTPPSGKPLMILGLAAAGLASCSGTRNTGGAVDPPPPQINCQAVGQGQTLKGTGTLIGTDLTIKITNQDYSSGSYWSQTPQATNAVGLTSIAISMDSHGREVTITAQLATPTTASGSFDLNGTLRDFAGNACLVTKKFTVTIGTGGAVTVALGSRPTLGPRPPIGIRMLAQHGLEVDLEGTGLPEGSRLEWTATGGKLTEQANGRIRWNLPEEAGLHQIELLVDAGEGRLALESLALEVG